MKTFTIADIQIRDPNYDIGKYLPENWSGTALDILRYEEMPAEDRLWVVLRPKILGDKTLRFFAVWCARSLQHLLTDPRSIEAIDVAEEFADGAVSKTVLARARRAAEKAWETARNGAAAWAAQATCERAAWAAAWMAAATAAVMVRKQSRKAQVAQLIKMLEAL